MTSQSTGADSPSTQLTLLKNLLLLTPMEIASVIGYFEPLVLRPFEFLETEATEANQYSHLQGHLI